MSKQSRLTRRDVKQNAKEIVLQMLSGRCSPDADDTRDVDCCDEDREAILREIDAVLTRLSRSLRKSSSTNT